MKNKEPKIWRHTWKKLTAHRLRNTALNTESAIEESFSNQELVRMLSLGEKWSLNKTGQLQ